MQGAPECEYMHMCVSVIPVSQSTRSVFSCGEKKDRSAKTKQTKDLIHNLVRKVEAG